MAADSGVKAAGGRGFVSRGSESERLWIKICGVRQVVDCEAVVSAGADAIGLNFVPGSPRCLSLEQGRELRRSSAAVSWIGVVSSTLPDELLRLYRELELDALQLHAQPTPFLLDFLRREQIPACFAYGIRRAEDVELARLAPFRHLVVDAKVDGQLGGTGQSFDWTLISELVAERPVILAGGLRPDNVERAVRLVRPFGIDTASGVESAPGVKSAELIHRFVAAARGGTASSHDASPS